ncbi:MAG: MerR family transcriptional regulator [Pseudomonadota bacterium]
MNPDHDPAEPADDAGEEISRDGYFPIRVVSQRTGVNSVTLRAWERRYGLLKPVRTPKGHRLYGEEDVARILRIVEWIDRGVSIGRVRGLLERDERLGAVDDDGAAAWELSDWQRYAARAQQAVTQFDAQRLDDTVNEALSLYPFVTVCERLLDPLRRDAGAGIGTLPGAAAAGAFVEGYLRRKLAARLQFDGKQAGGAPVLVAALPGPVDDIALLTLAVGCIGMEIPVLLLETALGVEDLLVIGERRPLSAIVLHGGTAQDAAAFTRFLQRLAEARLAPVTITGPAARIHERLIAAAGAHALGDDSPAAAVRRLERQGGRPPATGEDLS